MAGSRRPIKLAYRELYITCPQCRAPLVIGTVMEKLSTERTCPKCGKEFVIENDVPKKPAAKKPGESIRLVKKKTKAG
jgi:transposase-like protein